MPMFMVHLWLPMAHVEAPVSGSKILAGVLLMLGDYGLIRVLFLSYLSLALFLFGFFLSFVGEFFVSLFCMRQPDLGSLIAYYSVAHMSLVIDCIVILRYW